MSSRLEQRLMYIHDRATKSARPSGRSLPLAASDVVDDDEGSNILVGKPSQANTVLMARACMLLSTHLTPVMGSCWDFSAE